MQLRHSALTDANIMIFSDSPPRLQRKGAMRSLGAIAARIWAEMTGFAAAIAK